MRKRIHIALAVLLLLIPQICKAEKDPLIVRIEEILVEKDITAEYICTEEGMEYLVYEAIPHNELIGYFIREIDLEDPSISFVMTMTISGASKETAYRVSNGLNQMCYYGASPYITTFVDEDGPILFGVARLNWNEDISDNDLKGFVDGMIQQMGISKMLCAIAGRYQE